MKVEVSNIQFQLQSILCSTSNQTQSFTGEPRCYTYCTQNPPQSGDSMHNQQGSHMATETKGQGQIKASIAYQAQGPGQDQLQTIECLDR